MISLLLMVAADTLLASRPVTLSLDTLFFAEGIDIDSRNGAIYVTSIRHRNVYVVDADQQLRPFVQLPSSGYAMSAATGVVVDGARERLWIVTAGLRHMAAYRPSDSASSELVEVGLADGVVHRRWTLGDGTGTPGEIALTPTGDVLVSDGTRGVLYRLDSGAVAPRTVRSPLLRSPQGIAVSSDGRVAWVADWSRGILRWNLETDTITAVPLHDGQILRGVDGLRRAGERLIGVQNGTDRARIVAIALSPAGDRIADIQTLDRAPAYEGEPTVCAIHGDRYVFVASSSWPFFKETGERRAGTGSLPPVVVRELRLTPRMRTTASVPPSARACNSIVAVGP